MRLLARPSEPRPFGQRFRPRHGSSPSLDGEAARRWAPATRLVVHDEAAIDVQGLPRDVAAGVRGKEDRCAGEIFRELHAAERNVLFVLEEFGAVIGVHRRVDRTGGDGINPDPLAATSCAAARVRLCNAAFEEQ
jgi:hypothetical protein